MDKAALRQQFKESRNNAPYKQLKLNDISPLIQNIIHIAAYLPINNEIDTIPLINWILSIHPPKSIYIPRPNPTSRTGLYEMARISNLTTDIIDGPYKTKIAAPHCPYFESKQIEYWLIPGLAFTEKGHRLGYGGGVYDRLLTNTLGQKVGVAHQCQRSDVLPQDKWDVPVDTVLFL